MSRIRPRDLFHIAVPAATLLGLHSASCGGSDSATAGGGGGGGGGNAPPFVTALPDGGAFPQNQSVVINSNESATIYYYLTSDPNDPTLPDPAVPGSITGSGAAPLTGIAMLAPPNAEIAYRLSFLGVDAAGLASVPVTETYVIDRNVPTIGLSGDPAPVGLFETATVMWSATDDGTWFATLGGDGSPGSGIELAAGIYPTPPEGSSFPTLEIDVSGYDVGLGASDLPLTLFFADAAGNEASAGWVIRQKPLHRAPVPTGTREIAVAPSVGRVFALDAASDQVLALDPVAGQTTNGIDVDLEPNGLALTPDESALYVSCSASLQRIDPATAMVMATIPVVGGTPSGVAVTPDGARVYFTVSDGTLAYVNTANDTLMTTSVSGQAWLTSHIAMTADPASPRAAIAWRNASIYSLEAYDVVGDALLVDPLPDPVSSGVPGRVATANDVLAELAFAGGPANFLTRFTLSSPPGIEQFEPALTAGGLALTPTDSHLVLSQADSLLLDFRAPADLSTRLGTYDTGLAADEGLAMSGIGAALQVADWTDGVLRLYFVKNPDSASAELVGVALQ